MQLRPENLLAFVLSSIPLSALLHSELLPVPTKDLGALGVHLALVDHNKLLPQFTGAKVDAIIDHHDDEGLYTDAKVRVIKVPMGSCASLVTKHFMDVWKASLAGPAGQAGSPVPAELATLLLSSILIDTGGLKAGGKATPTDYESAAFLYPISTLSDPSTSALSASSLQASTPASLSDLTAKLSSAKFAVSHLSTHDLLLRDYKEYSFATSSPAYPNLQVGLSTVPLSLRIWLEKESSGFTSYLSNLDAYMTERKIDISGVLTSYQSEKKNKHKRELLLVVRSGLALDDASAEKILEQLALGLEAADVLDLETWGQKEGFLHFGKKKDVFRKGVDELVDGSAGRWGRVWQQGNAKATRKQVAPIMVSCMCDRTNISAT
jgi:exopolyphosphatase